MKRIFGFLALSLLACQPARPQGVAVVDAPSSPSADVCASINRALQGLQHGGTVDARNLVGTVTCASDMFAGVTPDATTANERAFTVLLGPATFLTRVPQSQPRNVAVRGVWGGGTGSSADPQWSGTKFKLDDPGRANMTLWQLRNAHNAILDGVSFDCVLAPGCVGIRIFSTGTYGAWRNRIENITIAHAAEGIRIGTGDAGCGSNGTVSCDASGLIIRNGTIREGRDRFDARGRQTEASTGIWIEGINAAQGSIIESILFQNLHTAIMVRRMEQGLRISSIDCGNGRGANSTCIYVGDVQNLVVTGSRNELDEQNNDPTYRFMRVSSPSKIFSLVLEANLFNGSRQPDGSYLAVDINTPASIVSIGNGGAGLARTLGNNVEVTSVGDRFPYVGNRATNFSGWVDAAGTNRIRRLEALP